MSAFVSTSGTVAVGFSPISTTTDRDVAAHLSANLEVHGADRALMERIWRLSPTFRRQCARLATASVTVTVERGFSQQNHTTVLGPMTRIQQVNGRLTAHVRLGGAQYDYSGPLAHEIEHVLEQLDGVNLPAAVAKGVRGAHRVGAVEVFETDRAVAVGRLVADEVKLKR